MTSWPIVAIVIAVIIGLCLSGDDTKKRSAEDIDLTAENEKLRKENEILWKRLEKTNRLD